MYGKEKYLIKDTIYRGLKESYKDLIEEKAGRNQNVIISNEKGQPQSVPASSLLKSIFAKVNPKKYFG